MPVACMLCCGRQAAAHTTHMEPAVVSTPAQHEQLHCTSSTSMAACSRAPGGHFETAAAIVADAAKRPLTTVRRMQMQRVAAEQALLYRRACCGQSYTQQNLTTAGQLGYPQHGYLATCRRQLPQSCSGHTTGQLACYAWHAGPHSASGAPLPLATAAHFCSVCRTRFSSQGSGGRATPWVTSPECGSRCAFAVWPALS